MTIESFDMAGYRCFRERQILNMKRMTLVYGRNNAGKSALVRLPALIAGSMTGTPGLNLEHPAVNLASFQDLVWRRGNDGRLLELGLTLSSGSRWGWALEWRDHIRQGAPTRIWVPSSTEPRIWAPPSRSETGSTRTFEDQAGHREVIEFQGLRPGGIPDVPHLDDEMKRVRWLSAIRRGPTRDGLPNGVHPTFHLQGGTWAESMVQDDAIRRRVSAWFAQQTGHAVVISQLEGRTRVRLRLLKEPAPDIPFPDAGEGLQHVFPVVVALESLRKEAGLLCIEEPEAHLHPGLQRALAGLVSSVLEESPDAQVLLETHSEPFLYEALLAAVDRLAGGVSLNWVRGNPGGDSVVESIALDSAGRPEGDALRRAFKDVGEMRRAVIEARRTHAG